MRHFKDLHGLSPHAVAVITAAAMLVCMTFLVAVVPITNSSETREARVVWTMLDSGNYLTPLRDGRVPSKPPLFHWCAAGIALLRGDLTATAVRFPSIIFAAGSLLFTMLLAAALSLSPDPAIRRKTALAAGALLALGYHFSSTAVRAQVDMTMTFFVTAAIFVLLRRLPRVLQAPAEIEKIYSSTDWSLFYAACGFGVLSKGPIGAVLPLIACGSAFWAVLPLKTVVRFFLRPRLGWFFFAAVAAPWYLLALLGQKQSFVDRQIVYENVMRFTGWGWDDKPDPVWFYIGPFLKNMLPLSLLFLWSVWAIHLAPAFRKTGMAGIDERSRIHMRIPLFWFTSGFLLFSLAVGKRAIYLLPLYPAVAVHAALALERLFFADGKPLISDLLWRRFHKILLLLLVLTLLFVEAGKIFPFASEAAAVISDWLKQHGWRFQAAALLGAAALYAWHRRPFTFGRAYLLFLGTFMWFAAVTMLGTGFKDTIHDFHILAPQVSRLVPADAGLAADEWWASEFLSPLIFHMKRRITPIPPRGHLPEDGFVLASREWMEKLPVNPLNAGWEEVKNFRLVYEQDGRSPDREIVLLRRRM